MDFKQEKAKELRNEIESLKQQLIKKKDELAELLYDGKTKTEYIKNKRKEKLAETIEEKKALMEKYKSERKETMSESIFKAKLKINNIRFEEQKSFVTEYEMYACDFFLPEYNIVVELDGGCHDTISQKTIDRKKNKFYKRNGYVLLRLKNETADKISADELKEYLTKHWERCKGLITENKKQNKIKKELSKYEKNKLKYGNKKYKPMYK